MTKYVNDGGERIDVPENYYRQYTDEKFEKLLESGEVDGCSCGGELCNHGCTHDEMVEQGKLICWCYCHD